MKINILPKVANSAPMQKYAKLALTEKKVVKNNIEKTVTNYSRLQVAFPTLLAFWFAGIQGYFLQKSKNLTKDVKSTLILQNVYSCAIGLAGGLLLGKKITKLADTLVNRADKLYKNEEKEILKDGIRNVVPVATTAIMYHYIGQVIATPMASQSLKYLQKKRMINLSESKGKDK
jgi:hypothetical protein